MRELLSAEQIRKRVEQLADRINTDYSAEVLDVVCILKGAMIFVSDLIRQLNMHMRIHFIHVSSYGAQKLSSGTLSLHFSSPSELKDRHVLLIEDILDTGITLEFLLEHLKQEQPASLKSCVLLSKPARRRINIEADYTGFEIEDQFVVGYGLDFNELYRNLPYVAILEE
jgi:hypoxanthine phosphoribosyltransferase